MCERLGKDPVSLSPEDVSPTPEELLRHPELALVPLQDMQLRFLVLRNFNRRLMDLLPLVDLSRPDRDQGLAYLIRQLRGLMLKHLKLQLFQKVLSRSAKDGNPTVVNINRLKASTFKATGRCDVRGRRTVFGQLFQAFSAKPAELLRKKNRAWKVVFQGEYADDYGGPYRESIAQLSQELQSPQLPLLVPVANHRNQVDQNQDRWVPNPNASSPVALKMFEFLGQLMGVAVRTLNPLELSLPRIVR